MLSVPFSLVGGVWLMWALDYQMSVAVAVGFIALAGVAAETGVIMLIYLDHAWQETRDRCIAEGREATVADLYRAIMDGAAERVRPKMMTVVAIMAGRRHGVVNRPDAGRDSGAVCTGEAGRTAPRAKFFKGFAARLTLPVR
jgi:hypothetical protein